MAKKFFYVCAGLLMLTLTYLAGVRSAGAQAEAIEVADIDNDITSYVAVVGRTVHSGIGLPLGQVLVSPPVPGTSRIVAAQCGKDDAMAYVVLLANGDIYRRSGGWVPAGNLLSGAPTSTQKSSWGALKASQR